MPSTSLLDRITKVLGFHVFEQPWWDDAISKSHDEENWSGAKPTNQLLILFLRKIHQVNLFMKYLAEISEFMKPALHTTRCAFSSNWSGVQTPAIYFRPFIKVVSPCYKPLYNARNRALIVCFLGKYPFECPNLSFLKTCHFFPAPVKGIVPYVFRRKYSGDPSRRWRWKIPKKLSIWIESLHPEIPYNMLIFIMGWVPFEELGPKFLALTFE